MSAPRTARDRVRDEVTSEIMSVARAHLARDGAPAVSLRSIARELEMAPSALYRYFSGRDALLSALILGAYESLADAAQAASDAAFEGDASDAVRWLAAPRAMRAWALAHPHEWGLIFGSPVPGYEAPPETVVPYARLAGAVVRPIASVRLGGRAGRAGLAEPSGHAETPLPIMTSPEMAAALAPVTEGILPQAPTETVALAMQVWIGLIGLISLELFGHWRNTVLDPELFFDASINAWAPRLGLG